jgi:hypothetical protein
MYAICKGQFSVRDRGNAAAMDKLPHVEQHRPIVIIAADTRL